MHEILKFVKKYYFGEQDSLEREREKERQKSVVTCAFGQPLGRPFTALLTLTHLRYPCSSAPVPFIST